MHKLMIKPVQSLDYQALIIKPIQRVGLKKNTRALEDVNTQRRRHQFEEADTGAILNIHPETEHVHEKKAAKS
jgi:hypothetical protein